MYRTKQRFVEEGLERALNEAPRPGAERKLGVDDESLLVAVACSKPPAGRSRWTLQLLADEMVRRTEHASISDETIRRRLDELQLKPWQEKMWCIPRVDAEFVTRMEDVLALTAQRSCMVAKRDSAHRSTADRHGATTAARDQRLVASLTFRSLVEGCAYLIGIALA